MTIVSVPGLAVRSPMAGSPPLRPITVDDYHQMLKAGILKSGEPYELIGGLLVLKDRSARGDNRMSIGHKHLWAVKNLSRIGRELEGMGCHMQAQGPVVMSNLDEPEPDGAIIIGNEDNFKDRLPLADEVTCVIEVADSSLAYDRTGKMAVYADSGIKQYVLINLENRVVELYTMPEAGKGRYTRMMTLYPGEMVDFALPAGKSLPVAVDKLLP